MGAYFQGCRQAKGRHPGGGDGLVYPAAARYGIPVISQSYWLFDPEIADEIVRVQFF